MPKKSRVLKGKTNSKLLQNPQLTTDIYYNCTECSSLIEIISFDEENNMIEFKCTNKNSHKLKMPIKEYLEKMEKFRQKSINEDICKEHSYSKNNKYIAYCFDCRLHLCEECLKTRNHINHNKNYIMEIKPIKEELNIMEGIIKYYKIQIDNFKNEKLIKTMELKNTFESQKLDENNRIKEIIQNNKNINEMELKLNEDKYLQDIKVINNTCKNELRERNKKYDQDKNEINKKFKLKNNKEYIMHEMRMNNINKKYQEQINNLDYDKKIDKINDIRRINEIVYNTYNENNNNFYNSVNINKCLLSYYNNEYIKNNIMKRILDNNYENIIKIKNVDKNEEIIDTKIYIKIDEIKNEYEKKMREIMETQEKEKKIYERKIKEIKEQNEKFILKYKEYKKILENKEEINKEDLMKTISHIYNIYNSIIFLFFK